MHVNESCSLPCLENLRSCKYFILCHPYMFQRAIRGRKNPGMERRTGTFFHSIDPSGLIFGINIRLRNYRRLCELTLIPESLKKIVGALVFHNT